MSRSRDASGKAGSAARVDNADAELGLFDLAGVPVDANSATLPASSKNADERPRPTLTKRVKVADDKSGHRERLRDRFRAGGADAMPDYELLEMILFKAYPRQDTKPLAKALIAHFNSFAEVVHAPVHRLLEVEGIGQRAVDEIKIVRAAALRMIQAQTFAKPVMTTWNAVFDYCMAAQGYDEIERFRILFLDKRNQLIADEVQQSGTVDHTPVYIREVVKRALEIGSTALVLVHNHPSGDPSPSRTDIDMTKLIVEAAKPLGIVVHDHIIIGRQGHYSMRAAKLI